MPCEAPILSGVLVFFFGGVDIFMRKYVVTFNSSSIDAVSCNFILFIFFFQRILHVNLRHRAAVTQTGSNSQGVAMLGRAL